MKKILYLILMLCLSLTFVSCTKDEDANDAFDVEMVTYTDENGVEFTYSKLYLEDVAKAFSILEEYTWEELKLFAEKERYLWGPEESWVGIEINDEVVRTVPVHAGVEVVYGDGSVCVYYVDTEKGNVYMWDREKGDYFILTKQNITK